MSSAVVALWQLFCLSQFYHINHICSLSAARSITDTAQIISFQPIITTVCLWFDVSDNLNYILDCVWSIPTISAWWLLFANPNKNISPRPCTPPPPYWWVRETSTWHFRSHNYATLLKPSIDRLERMWKRYGWHKIKTVLLCQKWNQVIYCLKFENSHLGFYSQCNI